MRLSETLNLEYKHQASYIENVLNHINEEFKGKITIDDIKNRETVYPCIRLPNNLNDQLFYEKKEFYKKLNKIIQDLDSSPMKYCYNPNDIHPIAESMWTFIKDSKIPNSHFSFLTNYGDFAKYYTETLGKLTKYEVWENVFHNKPDFDVEFKKVVNQIVTTKKTHVILLINEDEMKNKITLENLILYIEHGFNPINTDSQFRNEKVQDFKKTITPIMMHDYMINGNPNNINEKTIIHEFLEEIANRLHICLVFKDFDTYLKITKAYPHIKTLFRPVLPFAYPKILEKMISTNVSNEIKFNPELLEKMHNKFKKDILKVFLLDEEYNSFVQSETLASQFEEIGSFDKYQYYEVLRSRSVNVNADRKKFAVSLEDNYQIDHEFFSLKKYTILSVMFPTLLQL